MEVTSDKKDHLNTPGWLAVFNGCFQHNLEFGTSIYAKNNCCHILHR